MSLRRENETYRSLIDSIKSFDLAKMRISIAGGANCNLADERGFTPIQIAAMSKNRIAIKVLMANGANPRQLSESGLYPIASAALYGNIDALRSLAEHCADFEPPNAGSISALEHSLLSCQFKATEYLILHGADVDCVDENQQSLLERLCQAGNVKAACKIAAEKAFTSFSPTEITALTKLIATENLSHDDLDALSWPLSTSRKLQSLCKNKNIRGAKYPLLKRIVENIHTKTRTNFYRLRYRKNITLLTSLIDAGKFRAAILELSKLATCFSLGEHKTPLTLLCSRSLLRIPDSERTLSEEEDCATLIVNLLSSGISANERDHDTSHTLLHEICQNSQHRLLKLITHIPKVTELVNKSDNRLNRPLHFAVKSNSHECINLLANLGADMNPCNGSGFSPLHEAVLANKFQCVEILLKRGANPFLDTRGGVCCEELELTDRSQQSKIDTLLQDSRDRSNLLDVFSENNPFSILIRAGKIDRA